jgi:hypothetical protein
MNVSDRVEAKSLQKNVFHKCLVLEKYKRNIIKCYLDFFMSQCGNTRMWRITLQKVSKMKLAFWKEQPIEYCDAHTFVTASPQHSVLTYVILSVSFRTFFLDFP